MNYLNAKQQIHAELVLKNSKTTDKLFAYLLVFEWMVCVTITVTTSPLTWNGTQSTIHFHVLSSIFLGGLTALLPTYFLLKTPGAVMNKYLVTLAQFIFSVLIIHVTGGRIESHFHIFGSLAFLAIYRDYKPVAIFTLLTAADHFIRGVYWPESIYGIESATAWRSFEHIAWVFFEDIILFYSIYQSRRESLELADKQAKLEESLASVESIVEERTRDLMESQQIVVSQQEALIMTSKMSAIGEMAGGVAHEINTPLSIIQIRTDQLLESVETEEVVDRVKMKKSLENIDTTVKRITKIIQGLRTFARDSRNEPPVQASVLTIINDAIDLCREKFKYKGVIVRFDLVQDFNISCRPTQITQVLLNMLHNSHDAIEHSEQKWINIEAVEVDDQIEISVTDSGFGIPRAIRDKIMQPFFTTKPIGKGTGLGLSISRGIIESHNGKIFVDQNCVNTRIVISLPKTNKKMEAA